MDAREVLANKRIGLAMTGSFCTFQSVFDQLPAFKQSGACLQPILSYHAYELDSRFFRAEQVHEILETLCEREIWHTIPQVEPIGPKKLLDLLIIAPCTGNTLAKLAQGIVDTPVTMAAKSHLRNGRPVVIAISTNDGLSMSAKNIGALHAQKNVFFVPYGQDDPQNKPTSLVAHMDLMLETACFALRGAQIQPILRQKSGSGQKT